MQIYKSFSSDSLVLYIYSFLSSLIHISSYTFIDFYILRTNENAEQILIVLLMLLASHGLEETASSVVTVFIPAPAR